jgi:hypothetical protein
VGPGFELALHDRREPCNSERSRAPITQ